jgi:hypothetical protein
MPSHRDEKLETGNWKLGHLGFHFASGGIRLLFQRLATGPGRMPDQTLSGPTDEMRVDPKLGSK